MDGAQPGDPAKAVEAMIEAVNNKESTLRLPLGADAIGAIETKLAAVQSDVNTNREVATSTAYEGVTVGNIGG